MKSRAWLRAARNLLAAAPMLAAASTYGLSIDFEAANPFCGGTLSDEIAYSGNQSLWVGPGDQLTMDVPAEFQGKDIMVTMRVFDMGKWIDLDVQGRPSSAAGPRWGVSAGEHKGPQSLGAGIILRTFSHGGTFQGYGLQPAADRFATWAGPVHYSKSSRDHFHVPGTGGSYTEEDGWVAGEGGEGEWTTWTFRISGDGATTSIQLNDMAPMTSSNVAKDIGGTPTQIWLYGGSSTTTALSGMYVDDIKIFEEGSLAVLPRIIDEDKPTIDGQLDDVYRSTQGFEIATLSAGEPAESPEDLSATWYGVYDNERLYLLIDITDDVGADTAAAEGWQNDRVEIYFNMDNVRNPAGNASSGDNSQVNFHWNRPDHVITNGRATIEGVEWAQLETDKGWVLEVSFPWSNLTDRQIEENIDFGFDIALVDNDGRTSYDSIYYWFSTKALFGNMNTAGNIELGPVFAGNFHPSIEYVGLVEAQEGVESTINIVVDDKNSDDEITITAADLPAFATITDNGDRTATITINAQPGDANIYQFSVSASDGEFQDKETITLIVRDPAIPSQTPVFADVDDIEIDRGQVETITVSATDLDSLSLLIEATDLPAFVTFVDNRNKSATLTVAPTSETEPGDYTVTLTATDEDENTGTINIKVTVTNVVPRTTFYLDPVNGDLANDGSPENPWPSLTAVMEAEKVFGAGNVLYLLDGYHGEPVIKGQNAEYVYITADEGATPRLSRLEFGSQSSYWHVSGLSISREYAPLLTRSTMVNIGGQHNVVTDCEIFTVEDASAWGLTEWNNIASDGVSIAGAHNRLENSVILNSRFSVTAGQNSQFSVIRGNHIQWFAGDGIRTLGNDTLAEYNYIADNMKVNDNHDDGIQSWSVGDGGVGTGVVHRVILRGNVIVQTTDWERDFIGPLQGIGLFDGMFQDWIIENNSIAVNMWHGIALFGGINCVIRNNTVVDQDMNASPGPTWITVEPTKNFGKEGNTEEQNAYYRGRDNKVINNLTTDIKNHMTTADYVELSGNIEIGAEDFDVYFVDYPWDLRLKRGAPAINAGLSEGAATLDADGVERPQGSAVDVGAYEWAGLWRDVFPMDGEWADTGAFLGQVYVAYEPWLYGELETWLYLDDASFSSEGAWVFAADLTPANPADSGNSLWAGYALTDGWANTDIGWVYPEGDWIFVPSFGTWVYAPAADLGDTGSWIYAANSNAPDPV